MGQSSGVISYSEGNYNYGVNDPTVAGRENKNFWINAHNMTPYQKKEFFSSKSGGCSNRSYFKPLGLEGPTSQVSSNGMTLTENENIHTTAVNNKSR